MASETPMTANPLKALRPRALPDDCATALGKAVRGALAATFQEEE